MLKTVTVYKSVVIPGGDGVGTVGGVGTATYCRKDNKEEQSIKNHWVAFPKRTLTLNFTLRIGQTGSAKCEQVATLVYEKARELHSARPLLGLAPFV